MYSDSSWWHYPWHSPWHTVHPTSFRRHQGFRNTGTTQPFSVATNHSPTVPHGSPRPTSSQSVWVPGTGNGHLVKNTNTTIWSDFKLWLPTTNHYILLNDTSWPLVENGEATNLEAACRSNPQTISVTQNPLLAFPSPPISGTSLVRSPILFICFIRLKLWIPNSDFNLVDCSLVTHSWPIRKTVYTPKCPF